MIHLHPITIAGTGAWCGYRNLGSCLFGVKVLRQGRRTDHLQARKIGHPLDRTTDLLRDHMTARRLGHRTFHHLGHKTHSLLGRMILAHNLAKPETTLP